MTSGSFTQSNSRSGLPIFQAGNLAPGDSTSGSVTITNSGTLDGRFRLAPGNVVDDPGPNGGLLSQRLRLDVVEMGPAGERREIVYSGSLAAMSPRALGLFRAGQARTYRFTTTLRDGGPPASQAGGDNAYAGAATSLAFRWDAESAAPAGPPTAPRTGGDRRPPRLRLFIPRVQRVISRGYLTLRARCDEPCRLEVTGKVRAGGIRTMRTKSVRRRLARERAASVRVRIPPRARPALRRAILGGRRAGVRVEVRARDRAGNRVVAVRNVRLRRR